MWSRLERMKVANKFALAFLTAAVVGLTLLALLIANNEAAYAIDRARTDLASATRATSRAAETLMLRGEQELARSLVEASADASQGTTTVWVTEPAAMAEALEGHPLQGNNLVTWASSRGGQRQVVAAARIRGPVGEALVVSRQIVPSASGLLADLVVDELVTGAVIVILTALLARWLGAWLIAAPLGRVIDHTRRVGHGDLDNRLRVQGSAEFAALKESLNTMTDQLAASKERAEREIHKRLAAMEELRHVDRLRTVGTLASGIAHELGTPLNVVLLRARMIERSSPEAADAARIIAEQTERVSKIVRQLLDFARRRTPNLARHDIVAIAKHSRELLAALAQKRRVKLELVTPESPVYAFVDRGQIEQVVTNLVVNAIHASTEGATVTLAVEETEAGCKIVVVDRGEGISPANLERIYEPFFTTKDVGEGTGLGLPVAHGIVEDHGGTIEVTSDPGRGSTFAVLLPRDPAPVAQSARA